MVTNIAPTASAITAVAAQPTICNLRLITNWPMILVFTAIHIMTAIMGTEITLFTTADQNNALIGSMLVKPSPTPMIVGQDQSRPFAGAYEVRQKARPRYVHLRVTALKAKLI